ncbi:hypothetical protein [Haloplasma contractile]|uniref:Aminoglycoside phosphotransferase domain-containing protein n=1 Tax=Haloplasma contractile SSD-17B TaxID=1033810 RepID=U2DZF0_9MOLU|nr:hypothetical protein [Haloplasma contractile]ERJ13577.1 hypothetical protein HLPCO_000243 [Haloplasma contractile SSD-17B]
MNNIDDSLREAVEELYEIKIQKVFPMNTVFKIKTDDGKTFCLKQTNNKNLMNIYNYLVAAKFKHIILPIRNKNNEYLTSYKHGYLYVTPWCDDIGYPIERKLVDYLEILTIMHETTFIDKKFNKKQFVRTYAKQKKQLNNHFSIIDYFLVECESSDYKQVFEWAFLMNYRKIIEVKNIFMTLQDKIDTLVDSIKVFPYCMIHNNPIIDHFIVTNENKYFISLDKSILGISTHDFIKPFIEYCDMEVDWYKLVTENHSHELAFYYFIFNVLYYIVKNIDITYLSGNAHFESINSFIYTIHVINRACDIYYKYEGMKEKQTNES